MGLLVLSRRKDEKLVFGEPGQLAVWTGTAWEPIAPITVMVVDIGRDQTGKRNTRFGIAADRRVTVDREEIAEKRAANTLAEASSGP